MNIQTSEPSEESKIILESLKTAVANELEKKRRLGHYTVTWDGKNPVLEGEDAPKELNQQ
jgi:hypothetical protein